MDKLMMQKFIDELMNKLTLKEKIGQMYEAGLDTGAISGPEFDSSKTIKLIKEGRVGSILGVTDSKRCLKLQKLALNSGAKIPLLFCADIIHGCKTCFPINLALAGTFNKKLVQKVAKVSAFEATHTGINLTFSPMLDLVRDPRWGRVMESNGEDPFLNKTLAKAYVDGYHEEGLGATLKHFIGYGACEGGREYNASDIGPLNLNNYYLPAFKAGIKAKAEMVMTSFNTLDSIPVTCNQELLEKVLRKNLGFKGVIISDYNSSAELINHQVCKDLKEVSKRCIEAGLDHEMISTSYLDYLEELAIKDENILKKINKSARRMLELKYRLGLFSNPFKNIYPNSSDYFLNKESLDTALKASYESILLLENKNILPLSFKETYNLLGNYATKKTLNGSWSGLADNNSMSLKTALLQEKINLDAKANTIIYACGEEINETGEASSKADINFNLKDLEKIKKLKEKGKKIVLIIYAGRPLILTEVKKYVDAIVYAYFLGTMASKAIVDTIFGKNNPSAKVPLSFPYSIGQIPVYYNELETGRNPRVTKDLKYQSHYLDIPNEALYPFSYGLSYNEYLYSDLKLVLKEKTLDFSFKVKNLGKYEGFETSFLFVNKLRGFMASPRYSLKGFIKTKFLPFEEKELKISMAYDELYNYNKNFKKVKEEGDYEFMVGGSINELLVMKKRF